VRTSAKGALNRSLSIAGSHSSGELELETPSVLLVARSLGMLSTALDSPWEANRPIAAPVEQLAVEQLVRVDGGSFCSGQHDAQGQACRATTVLHALSQVHVLHGSAGPAGGHELLAPTALSPLPQELPAPALTATAGPCSPEKRGEQELASVTAHGT
jgi:hypothetical protein